MTIQQRVDMFKYKYPQKSLSTSRLERIYKAHGIKRKKVKLKKELNFKSMRRLKSQIKNAKDEL